MSDETTPGEPNETAEAAPPRTRTRRTRKTATESPASGGASGSASDAIDPPTSDAPPRMAATALLFQAPEPPARPRRRVEAPAGPPRPVEHDGSSDEGPAGRSAADNQRDARSDSDRDGDDDDQGGARRRRRGGRGRRKTGTTEQPGGPDSAEAQDQGQDQGQDQAKPKAKRSTKAEDERPASRTSTRAKKTASEAGDPGADTSEADADQSGAKPERKKSGKGRSRSRASEEAQAPEVAEGGQQDAADDATSDGADSSDSSTDGGEDASGTSSSSRRRRRRRRSRTDSGDDDSGRQRGKGSRSDEVTALKGSTRLEAKRQRRREGRDAGRRRTVVTEAEFLARRESVDRAMVVREAAGRVQIAVLEDKVLVEHYVSRAEQNATSPMVGNVYLGRVQNVLPSMEAAFVDIGKGRNAVLYAGEVNWDAAGLEGQPRRIEQALKSGDSVLVQVTKDPVGHKGARLTSQITLAGRYLVYVPGGGMTGISRKLPDNERARLKKILKEIVPDDAGVIVRTAAEGASDEELRRDVTRLQDQWAAIEKKTKTASAPALLQGEPDLAIRVVRDIFNDDFASLVVQGDQTWTMISEYVSAMAPDLAEKVSRWTETDDVFVAHRVDEQLAKGMDRKVWLPSGGSLVIDRTEAMTVIDVNTGKFTGSGGTLEETVTRNNLEAAEEIVRQLRLRDIGGIIVIDFIDMVLESNRDLVLRRLVECLGRDRTKHQVAEVTSLGLVQMTRKRVGLGLIEAFSETCQHCNGRGFIVHADPVEARPNGQSAPAPEKEPKRSRKKKASAPASSVPVLPEAREAVKATLATIAAAAAHAHEHKDEAVTEGEPSVTASSEPDTDTDTDAKTFDPAVEAPEAGDTGQGRA